MFSRQFITQYVYTLAINGLFITYFLLQDIRYTCTWGNQKLSTNFKDLLHQFDRLILQIKL